MHCCRSRRLRLRRRDIVASHIKGHTELNVLKTHSGTSISHVFLGDPKRFAATPRNAKNLSSIPPSLAAPC